PRAVAGSQPVAVQPPVVRIGILVGVGRSSLGADSGVLVREAASASTGRELRVARATFRPAARAGRPVARLVEAGDGVELAVVSAQEPTDTSLAADVSSYRGAFEIRAESELALSVVNVVNLEDYLRGVVPNELSPAQFPELEALKAQAVAARTYALRNLGL